MNREWFFRCIAWSNLNLIQKLNREWTKKVESKEKSSQIVVGFYFHWYYICLLLGIGTICNAMHTHINFHGLISWLGGSTISNILEAKWSASWNESCSLETSISLCWFFIFEHRGHTVWFSCLLCFKWACFFRKNVKEWEAIWYSPQTRSASATCYTACTQYGQNLGKFRGRRSIWGRNMNHMYGMVNSRLERV